MNDLIVKNFNGKKYFNFVWNNRPCWIAMDIAGVFEYTQQSKAVTNCVKRENFEKGIEIENGYDLPKYIEEELME